MAIAPRHKVASLVEDFGTQAEVARLLGVDRATISRWKRGAPIDPDNAHRVDVLLFVLSEARRVFGPQGARHWLYGIDAHLGDARPADLLAQGRTTQVVSALSEHAAGSYA